MILLQKTIKIKILKPNKNIVFYLNVETYVLYIDKYKVSISRRLVLHKTQFNTTYIIYLKKIIPILQLFVV
jgi:hypothetical protein